MFEFCKELKIAKHVNTAPQKLMGLPNERRPSFSSVPVFDDGSNQQLMISHEGKQQDVPGTTNKRVTSFSADKSVFVRLALLRPRDVFVSFLYQNLKGSGCNNSVLI